MRCEDATGVRGRLTGAGRTWSAAARIALALCLVFGLVSCGRRDPLRNLESAKVVHIRDGDTIELDDGRAVRYIGIDTPEKGEPGADSATVFNSTLVLGKTVRLEYGPTRTDRYGRTLAFVHVDGQMVSYEILKAGWAWCYIFEDNLRHTSELIRSLQNAMDNHRGLWKTPHLDSLDHYVAAFSGHRFHRPDCPSVSNISRNSERAYSTRDAAIYDGFSPCKRCRP